MINILLLMLLWRVHSCYYHRCHPHHLLSMKSKQKRMMASAPMESLSICSSCISSQLFPMNPGGHRQVYLSMVSRLIQTPPFAQGLSRHSFRSTHDFPSGVTLCPRGQLLIIFYKVLKRWETFF